MNKVFGIISHIAFFLFSGTLYGQLAPVADSLKAYSGSKLYNLDSSYLVKFPTVNFDQNYFRFFSNESPNWEHLFARIENMELTKQGKLNFYHIGGSHLQADIYTHDVRTKFQTEIELLTGERGWIFPYDLTRTNNPWNYECSSPNKWKCYRSVETTPIEEDLGLLGIKLECQDSSVQIKFRYDKTSVKSEIQRIRVYHNKGEFPFKFNWGKSNYLVKKKITDTLVGYTEIYFMRPIVDFELNLDRTIEGKFPIEIYGIQLMNDYPGISYSSVGINGSAINDFLSCKSFEEQLGVTPPDFFAFSLGTNDANIAQEFFDPLIYKANLDSLIQIVLRTNPKCALLLTVPNDSYYMKTELNPNIEKQKLVIQELALKYQSPIWDLYGIMGGLGSSKQWQERNLMQKDLIHFTIKGYHLIGDLYFDAFEKAKGLFKFRESISAKGE